MELGSKDIVFSPESIMGGNYEIDIKTAGSITLILQAFMIPAVFADGPVKITIIGGSDVRWSPSVDYLEKVTLPILKLMGYRAKTNFIQRGHYPRGGGILELEIDPVQKLTPLNVTEQKFDCIYGISHCANLPEHVAERQAKSAEKILMNAGYPSKIRLLQSNKPMGPGSGIFLWTNGITPISGSSIGSQGKKAEIVGYEAAEEILYHISKKSALDKYMGDQIIPYMALAGNSRIKTAELTQHTLTNIYVTEKFINKKFQVDGSLGESSIISVN
jgi:RNA 3'-terminal phosphate cyclase (ATP)